MKVTTDYGTPASVVINGHTFIDLGLPSGILWAETNIGAETAYDDGNYYAWGETEPKDSYSWDTYLWGTSYTDIIGYDGTDGVYTLKAADDAATSNWGSECRMPTQAEFVEFLYADNCTWSWTSKTTSEGSTTINGYEVRSTTNGNTIFFPASGVRNGNDLDNHGSSFYYWSSSLYMMGNYSYNAYSFDGGYPICERSRQLGCTVRPVAEPQE